MKAALYILVMMTSLMLAGPAGHAQDIQKIKIDTLDDYIKKSDHPMVVNFWATWCAPCVEELPYFSAIAQKYREQGLELVLVSLDFKDAYPASIRAFLKKKQLAGTFCWLDETDADRFCPVIDPKWTGAIPVTLLINPATGYRKFFGRPLTERQVELEFKRLVLNDPEAK